MVKAMPDTPKPGRGFFGWLGRQVGYVSKAMKTDVAAGKTLYRNEKIEEKPLPEDPSVVLRRTTRDEVIIAPKHHETDQADSRD